MDESPDRNGPAPLPTGTVTFLLSDVESSTGLWEGDPAAMTMAMARHEEILAEAIARHGGARPLAQGEGDSVVAVFCRASDAACAALAAQAGLQGESWPEGATIRVRMGLHTGEDHVVDGSTYAGRDLNRCARIRDLAAGGQIFLSRTTHGLLAAHPPERARFRDLGSRQVKGIERPEHLFQLCHPLLEDRHPELRSQLGVPTNLPACPTELIGRDDDLEELLALGDEVRLITITGSGGAGKTRLALALAEAAMPANPDGVWWVDLAPLSEPELVVAEVLEVVGERAVDHRPVDALCDALAHRTATIVLDNAEHVLEACAEMLDAVMARAPSVRLVVTSREPVGVVGEWSWRIPSLVVPGPDASVEETMATSAVRLFAARARQARPGFVVTAEVAPDVARICRRLDGLPLGIELAAARVRMMSPERIASGLDDRFRLLTGGGRRALARQQTLQSSVEWSHSLLDADEQRVFRRLAVFAGGFSIDAAEAVVSGDDLDPYAVLDLVTRLVDKSLVVADLDEVDARFHLLETMRQFAHDRLVIADEVENRRDAHLAWAVALASEAEAQLTGPRQLAWLARLERDHDNLRAAVDWAAHTGDSSALSSLAGSLPLFWVLHGHYVEAAVVYELARYAAGDNDGGPPDGAARRRVLWGSAYTALGAGEFARAFQDVAELVASAEHAGDDRMLARGLTLLGPLRAGEPDEAKRVLSDAAEVAAEAGDVWTECDALQKLAGTHVFRDEQRTALDLLELAGPLAHALDNHPMLAVDAALRAHIALRTGSLDDAARWAARAIGEAECCGDLTDAGLAFVVEGEVAIRRGRAAEAIPVIRDRLGLCVSAGANMLVPGLKALLALAHAAAGDPVAGLAVLDDTTSPSGGLFGRRSVARGVIELALGHDKQAEELLAGQRADRGAGGHPVRSAEIDVLLATIAARRDETKRPRQLAHDALRAGATGPFPQLIADAAIVLAKVAALEGDHDEAARTLGGVEGVLAASAATCTPLTAVVGPPELDALRADLGDDRFERAWAAGRACSTDELVAYLSRSRGRNRRATIGWDSLTPTELAVVRLVAEGLTNQAIGHQLFITSGTVKTHLTHVYAKLGAANRAEVAAEVARRSAMSDERAEPGGPTSG